MPISDYQYEIIYDGSGEGTIQDEGSSSQIRYLIQWADLPAFIAALKGGWRKLNDLNWTYTEPEHHPIWTNLFAQTVGYEKVGSVVSVGNPGARVVAWEYAIVTATFTALPTDTAGGGGGDEVVAEELDFYADVLTFPGEEIFYSDGTAASQNRAFAKIIPGCNYIITIFHVPELPGGDASLIFRKLESPVNSSSFRGAAAGKMLFMGARAARSLASYSAFDNLKHWHLEYRFNYRPIGWNKGYKENGVLDDLWLDAAHTVPLYASSDLNELMPSRLGGGINPNP